MLLCSGILLQSLRLVDAFIIIPFTLDPLATTSLVPSVSLITSNPGFIRVPNLVLHPLHHVVRAHVLALIVAQLDGRNAFGIRQLDNNIERNTLVIGAEVPEVVGEERANAESGSQTSSFGRLLVLDTLLYVQRVGEDDRLGVFDALGIVESAHHLDEFQRIAAVLTRAGEDLRVAGILPIDVVCGVALRCRTGECLEESRCSEGVCECDAEYALAECAGPVLERFLICVGVVVRERGNAHEPLVGNGADGCDVVLHCEVNVRGSAEFALESLALSLLLGVNQAFHDDPMCLVVASPTAAKLAKEAAALQQLQTLVFRFLQLAVVVPVGVDKFEVSL